MLIFEVSHAGNLDAGLVELCDLLLVSIETFVDLNYSRLMAWLMKASVEVLFQQLLCKMWIKMVKLNYCPGSMIPVLPK